MYLADVVRPLVVVQRPTEVSPTPGYRCCILGAGCPGITLTVGNCQLKSK